MFLYGQRRENVLNEIPCRTTRFLNSFYTNTIRSWNNIGYEFRNCGTLRKYLVYMTLVVLKVYFNLGLKNHNFLDIPSAICDCGGGKKIPSISLLNVLYLQLPRLI